MIKAQKNYKTKEKIAFVITNGAKTTSFLKIGSHFFIHAGECILISPSSRVKSVEIEDDMVSFHFFMDESPPCQISLVDDSEGMIGYYIDQFLKTIEEQKKSKNEGFLTTLISLPIFRFPEIARINISDFIDLMCAKKHYHISPSGMKVWEIVIPDDLKIKKTESKFFVKWRGLRIPIRDYIAAENGEYTFIDIIYKTAASLENTL